MVQYVEDRSCKTQFELGQMYHLTEPTARDYEQAVKWYAQAAKQGYRRAQHRLGSMYAKGLGVSRDLVQAYVWCKLAAAQQSRSGLRKLQKIEVGLSAAQLTVASRLAQEYHRLYVRPFV